MERQPEDASLVRDYSDSLYVVSALTLKLLPNSYSTSDTRHENPQYQITLQLGEGDNNVSDAFISLMQESQRALRNVVKNSEVYLPVQFFIYKVSC